MAYRARASHDGQPYELDIQVFQIPKFSNCGELVSTNQTDAQITQALRTHLRLLTREQILQARDTLALLAKELAEHLGVTEETVRRWESALLVQSRAMDNLLHVYFALPGVRAVLTGGNQDPGLGLILNQSAP